MNEEQLGQLVAQLRYQPYYCEENVWWLCQAEQLAEQRRWALFISNARKQCAIWHQRAASGHGFVVWDYHVVLLAEPPSGGVAVWDLDCTLGMPLPLRRYLDASFPKLTEADAWLRPQFRLVEAASFLARFASDRRHMKRGEGYQQPPPSWPVPRGAEATGPHTLDRFIDLSDDIAGEVLDLPALRARWSLPG